MVLVHNPSRQCTTLLDNVCYQCLMFQVESFYSFEIIARTKIRSETLKLNKGNNSKNKGMTQSYGSSV